MSNPTIPSKYTGVFSGDVILCKHVLIGCNSIILPGVTMKEGSVLGALSLTNKDCEEFFIYKGNPATKFLKRSKKLLELEKEFLKYR
jgi:galactoside O-acetyltransferase